MSEADSTAQIEYRPIPEFPGYRVGSDGSVWSCWKKVMLGRPYGCRRDLDTEWYRLNPSTDTCGYPIVGLHRNGKQSTKAVHRLVALCFIGVRPNGLQVCHSNGIRTDNRIENLRYDTPKANQSDRKTHGTDNRGERSGNAKLTDSQVQNIRILYAEGTTSLRELGKQFGVSFSHISNVVRRKVWTHIA